MAELPVSIFFISAFVILVLAVLYTKSYYPMLKYLAEKYPNVYKKTAGKFLYHAIFMFNILFTKKLSLDETLNKYQLAIRMVFVIAFLYALGIIIYAALQ